jgi:hypothetical protein
MGSTGGGRAGCHARARACSPWASHPLRLHSAARWTAPLDLAPCSLPHSRVVTSAPPLIPQTRGAHGKYGRGAGWLPREGAGLLPMGCTNSSLLFLRGGRRCWTSPHLRSPAHASPPLPPLRCSRRGGLMGSTGGGLPRCFALPLLWPCMAAHVPLSHPCEVDPGCRAADTAMLAWRLRRDGYSGLPASFRWRSSQVRLARMRARGGGMVRPATAPR